jgi:hypothetical protein
MQKGLRKMQTTLGKCEVDAIVSGADCAATEGATLDAQVAAIDALPVRCAGTTGMLGCLFDPNPDPQCLGTSARSIATTLVDATLGNE